MQRVTASQVTELDVRPMLAMGPSLVPDPRQKRLLHAVEAATVQDCRGDRAGGARVAQAHIAAAGIAVDRHFRHERNADPRRDHS